MYGKNCRTNKKIISILLSIAIFAGALAAYTIPVRAQEAYSGFELYVISEKESAAFTGEFAFSNDIVYVSEETLIRMGDVEVAAAVDIENAAFVLERGGLESAFSEDEVLQIEQVVYYPMIKALGEMCLRASFVEEDRVLIVEQCADLSGLENLMEAIYCDKTCYMGYMDNRDFLYNASIASDMIKNMNFLSYITGTEQTMQYQEAFFNALLPDHEDDLVIMAQETDKLLEIADKYTDLGGDLYQRLTGDEKSGFLGDYGEIIHYTAKTADVLQLAEIISLGDYLRNMDEINESYARGLELLLRDSRVEMDDKMYHAGAYALSLYKKQIPIGEAVMISILEGGSKDLEKFLGKKAGKLLKIDELAIDITNLADNSLFRTQEKIDASLALFYRLNIQNECREYYKILRQNLSGASWEEKQQILQQMHDVMGLYLRCGVLANRAVAIDEELETAAEISVKRLNDKLSQLAQYREADFLCTEDTTIAEKEIKKFLSFPLAEMVLVEFKWNGKNQGGEISDLNLTIEGLLDNGNSIWASDNDRILYGDDGDPVLEIEKEETSDGKSLKIFFYEMEGIYQITLEDGESMELYQDMAGISNADVKITVTDKNENEILLDASDCLSRSYTGFWSIGVCIDHGKAGEYLP